mgnify:CR=1 FL=1
MKFKEAIKEDPLSIVFKNSTSYTKKLPQKIYDCRLQKNSRKHRSIWWMTTPPEPEGPFVLVISAQGAPETDLCFTFFAKNNIA